MSVLKSRRGESKAQFCATADRIYIETLNFCSRLSARYGRLLDQDVMHLASEVADYAEKANTMLPVDEQRYNERKLCLLRSREALVALDVKLSHIYEILLLNPEGAFAKANGGSVNAGEALKRLDHMAQSLGELIEEEERLLGGVMKSDQQTFAKKQAERRNGKASI